MAALPSARARETPLGGGFSSKMPQIAQWRIGFSAIHRLGFSLRWIRDARTSTRYTGSAHTRLQWLRRADEAFDRPSQRWPASCRTDISLPRLLYCHFRTQVIWPRPIIHFSDRRFGQSAWNERVRGQLVRTTGRHAPWLSDELTASARPRAGAVRYYAAPPSAWTLSPRNGCKCLRCDTLFRASPASMA